MNCLAGLNTPLREPFYATPETWRHMPDENQWMQNAIPRQGNFRSPPMEADVPVDAGRTPWIGQDVAMENALSALAWDETAGTQVAAPGRRFSLLAGYAQAILSSHEQ